MQEPRFPRIPPNRWTRASGRWRPASPPGHAARSRALPCAAAPSDLADRLQQLGEHLRFGTGLPPELVELAVLVTARHWDCQYEWFAHRRIALNTTSLDAAVIDAIAHGQPLPAMPDEQRDACDFCGELLRDGEPGERAYDAILQRYGRRGVLDLLALCGYYGLLAMVLNTARIPLPDGTPAPLPPKHRS